MLSFFSAYGTWGEFALRLAVGVVFIVHGWPKVKRPQGIAQALGVPSGVGRIQGLLEILAGLALILRVYLHVAGLVISIVMLGAIYMKKFRWKTPFTAHTTTGWEFDLVLLGAGLYFLTL